MCTVAPAMLMARADAGRRLRARARLPLIMLAVLSLVSLGARVALIGEPCQAPCTLATDHVLIFDEAYYVNAARVIAGLRPPGGAHYANAPAGTDPNAEHPQLAKLIIAGSIELFGDGPLAWRLGSLVFGSLAILGMYALVRAAGGGAWLALGAATLMAADNLLLVHARIGTLDVFVLTAMVWSLVLYLRGRPVLAGAVLGVGACFKLVAPYLVLVIVLIEALRVLSSNPGYAGPRARLTRRAPARLGAFALTAAVVFVGLLGLLDAIATPYDDAAAKLITGGPFAHIAHMFSYAAHQSSPHGPQGIASYPWQWLADYKPITYLRINPSHPGGGLYAVHPVSRFLGMISPPIMLLAVPSILFAGWRIAVAWRRRRRARASVGALGGERAAANLEPASEPAIVGLAWSVGTFMPFELLSLIWSRTSYLYYMVIVMPGIYVAVAYLLSGARRWKATQGLAAIWGLSVLVAAVVMYPFTPLF